MGTATRSAERAEFLAGLVTTALEGGIGYWSAAEEYRWFDPDNDGGTAEPGPGGTANAYAVIVPDGEESDGDHWPTLPDGRRGFRLDLDAVDRALALIRRGGVPGWPDGGQVRRDVLICDENNGQDVPGAEAWAGDLDADAADWVAQVAVFGQVVYG